MSMSTKCHLPAARHLGNGRVAHPATNPVMADAHVESPHSTTSKQSQTTQPNISAYRRKKAIAFGMTLAVALLIPGIIIALVLFGQH